MKTTKQKFSTEYIRLAKVKDASLKYSFARDTHEQTTVLVGKFDYEIRMIAAAFLADDKKHAQNLTCDDECLNSVEASIEDPVQEQESSSEETTANPDAIPNNNSSRIKDLFKKIAVKCHPDKLASQNLTSREMHFMLASYEQARTALTEDDEPSMVCVGVDLDVVGRLGIEGSCNLLNISCNDLEQKISALKSTPIWLWGEAGGDLQSKANILCKVLQHTLGQPVDSSEALNAIKSFYAAPRSSRRTGQHPGPGLRKERTRR
jgi:hypothetical protein